MVIQKVTERLEKAELILTGQQFTKIVTTILISFCL